MTGELDSFLQRTKINLWRNRFAFGEKLAHYYVNEKAQDNGDHEVHEAGCSFMPSALNRTYLGDHPICAPAVAKAKLTYRTANGCYYCSRACHTN